MKRSAEHLQTAAYLREAFRNADDFRDGYAMADWLVGLLVAHIPHDQLPHLLRKVTRDLENNNHAASGLLNINERNACVGQINEFRWNNNAFRKYGVRH